MAVYSTTPILNRRFKPSEPCSCHICISYCSRPGWWTVDEAKKAMEKGYAPRMMLELSPDNNFGVLAPAFKGNECNFALQVFSNNPCTFLKNGKCELFGSGFQPLECRFCHHDRQNQGYECHAEIAKDWNTPKGKRLIVTWGNMTDFWKKMGLKLILK